MIALICVDSVAKTTITTKQFDSKTDYNDYIVRTYLDDAQYKKLNGSYNPINVTNMTVDRVFSNGNFQTVIIYV